MLHSMTVALSVILAAATPGLAVAAPIVKLKVTLYTDQDDKDDSEEVTIEIVRSGNGEILGRGGPYGNGETWDDQTHQRDLGVSLKPDISLKDLRAAQIRVSKSCEQGWPVGKGWHFCVATVVAVDEEGNQFLIRSKETPRVLLGERRGTKGPTSTIFDLFD